MITQTNYQQQLTGSSAFDKFLSIFGSGIIWLKTGHRNFWKGEIVDGKCTIYKTKRLDNGSRELTGKSYDGFTKLRKISEYKGGGVFFLPARPSEAPLKKYHTGSNLISCEMDDGSTEEQLARIKSFSELSGLDWALVIGSGGKSKHPHLKADQWLGVEQRLYLQKLLSMVMRSDPAVNNPHQPMRIPGFYRKEKEKEQTLDYYSYSAYSYEQLLEGISKVFSGLNWKLPEPEQLTRDGEGTALWGEVQRVLKRKKLKDFDYSKLTDDDVISTIKDLLDKPSDYFDKLHQSADPTPPEEVAEIKRFLRNASQTLGPIITNPGNGIVNLIDCLYPYYQDLIRSGIGAGGAGRDPEGFKLSCHIQQVEEILRLNNINYSGNGRSLLDEYCSRCSPPLSQPNADKLWGRFSKYGNKYQLDEGILLKKVAKLLGCVTKKVATICKEQWEKVIEFIAKELKIIIPKVTTTISFYDEPTQELANNLSETLIGSDEQGGFLYNKKALLKQLQNHARTIPLRIYPAVGYQSKKTLKQLKELGNWLSRKGYKLEVGWYEQWYQKSASLLEFLESGDEIEYISWEEFLDQNRYSKLCYKRNKEFTPNIEYDQQYLDGEEIAKQIIQLRCLAAIKSPMGTGKTVLIGKIKEQFPDQGSFLIAHRNSLLQQSCKELGFTHMRFDDAYHLARRPGTHLAFCPDSITRIDYEDLEDRIVYLDEISSILPHILIGATCKKHRKHIIDKFTYMLRHAFAVVSLDANQKNWEVDHLLKLGQFEMTTKIQNIYQKKPLDITFFNGTKDLVAETVICNPNDILPLITDIKNNHVNGKTVVVCSDSQNFTEFLHQYLGGEANKEIIRVDGQTISEDWIRKLIKNPNSIAKLGCKVLIYSPTMDTGVSITLKDYFEGAYSLNFHLGAEAFSQLPGRIRDTNVPWTHWSKQFLGGDDGIHSSDPEKVVLHLLTSVFSDVSNSFSGEETECIKRAFELVTRSQDDNFKTACLIKAQQNYEKQNLRQTYYEKLVEDGHNVMQVWGAARVEDDNWKTAKEEVKNRYSKLLYNAEDISILEAEEIQQSLSATPEKQRAAAKAMLTQVRLPGLMDTPLWKKHGEEFLKFLKYKDRKCISRLELRHILFNPDLEICRKQAWLQWLNIGVESDTGAIDKLILTDIYSPQFRAKILRDIGVLDLIENTEAIYDNESPELKALARKANHWTRQPYLGRRGGLDLIRFINKIISQVGFKLTMAKKEEKKRYYKLTDLYESKPLPITTNLLPIIASKYASKLDAANTYMEKTSKTLAELPIMDTNIEGLPAIVATMETELEVTQTGKHILAALPEALYQDFRLRLGDLIDFSLDGRAYGMAKVVEIAGDVVKALWGWGSDREMIETSVELITKVWRMGVDGLEPVWLQAP